MPRPAVSLSLSRPSRGGGRRRGRPGRGAAPARRLTLHGRSAAAGALPRPDQSRPDTGGDPAARGPGRRPLTASSSPPSPPPRHHITSRRTATSLPGSVACSSAPRCGMSPLLAASCSSRLLCSSDFCLLLCLLISHLLLVLVALAPAPLSPGRRTSEASFLLTSVWQCWFRPTPSRPAASGSRPPPARS